MQQSAAITLASTNVVPILLGSSGRQQWRVVVRNLGPLTVWVGNREDLSPPNIGIPVALGETFTQDGADPLYVMLEPVNTSNVPTIVTTLQVTQYSTDSPGAASIAGPVFPWPTPPDGGQQ